MQKLNLCVLGALLLLGTVSSWGHECSDHEHHQQPKLGSFWEDNPLHGKFRESYYTSKMKLCEYTNGFLTGTYGKGAIYLGLPLAVQGYVRGWRTVGKAAGTWTEFYPATNTSDSGSWWGDIVEEGRFFNGTAESDSTPGPEPWDFELIKPGQGFCPKKIDYFFPLIPADASA